MDTVPRMQFRRLEDEETELALEIARSLVGNADESNESFGLESINALPGCDAWGLFMKGELSGAAWARVAGTTVTVVALALPRTWRRMGLPEWMLDQIAQNARTAGANTISLTVQSGTLHLGEVLTDAGFAIPMGDPEKFPAGAWSRPIAVGRG